jgi:surfactin synthase thioesterase subunit
LAPVVAGGEWFVCSAPRPDAPVRLFCLPYAGAGASVYRRWPEALGPGVEVQAVQLPGRESRILERPVIEPADVAAAVAAMSDRPYALYGHSMGARLGFEVVRALRGMGAPLPVRLYVGACRAPHLRGDGPFDGLSPLPDDELLDRLAAGGGVPAEVLAEPELVELLLPALRCDFRWLDEYVHTPQPPLPVPVVAFAATDDVVVTDEEVCAWRQHADRFTLHRLDGGHFFLHERLGELAGLLTADLRAAVGTVPAEPGPGNPG